MDATGSTMKEELRQSLDEIIVQAHENGVDIEDGAYHFQHDDPDIPDWEIILILLQS